MSEAVENDGSPITEFTKGQRRVLGTLLEKAFTTPEVYPLTVKALTAGCNQKSNRHPMTEYSEDDVLDFLDQLRQLGLVAVVHTETGRTERFRHYVRKRYPWNEPQLAIMTELLLRGRQSLGDLRARASRFVPIDQLDDLRAALRGLIDQKFVQVSGPLERRGVEIDHNLYKPEENKQLTWENSSTAGTEHSSPEAETSTPPRPTAPRESPSIAASAQSIIRQLQEQNRELVVRLEGLESDVRKLRSVVDRLERDLGG